MSSASNGKSRKGAENSSLASDRRVGISEEQPNLRDWESSGPKGGDLPFTSGLTGCYRWSGVIGRRTVPRGNDCDSRGSKCSRV